MTRLNVYSGAGLDRADHLRGNEGAMGRILGDPATRFVAVWRSRNLVAGGTPDNGPAVSWLSGESALALAERAGELVFLGLETSAATGDRAYVALDFSEQEAPHETLALDGAGEFRDLREIGALFTLTGGHIFPLLDGCVDTRLHDLAMLESDFPQGLEVVRVDAAGHFLHQEKPDAVNRLMIDWLQQNRG